MKKQFLLLSLFACMSTGIVAQTDQNKSCSFSSCCKLKTCAPTPISKPTTITKSGCYCLTQDICGQITIAADNVTLDLNCHEVNGNGADAAIAADGHYNVTVKNGTVSNFLVIKNRGIGLAPNRCGIAISNGTDIELHDLNVTSADPVGMVLTDCVGLNISGCDFNNNNRALLLSGCRNGKVSCCALYDNVLNNENAMPFESNAIVVIQFCDCIEFVDVDVCNNKNNFEVDIFAIDFSSNTSLERCKVNGNGADVPVSLQVITLFASENFSMTDCQVNNNAVAGPPVGDLFTLSAFGSAFSPNCVIRRSQFNDNSLTNGAGQVQQVSGCSLNASPGSLIEECQANNNTLAGAADPADLIFARGFLLTDCDGTVIRGCQANGNSSSGILRGIEAIIMRDAQIIDCQANNNSAGQQVFGFFSRRSENIDIINFQANNNFSEGLPSLATNAIAGGICLTGSLGALGGPFNGTGYTIEGCETNNNNCADGAAFGIGLVPIIFTGTPFSFSAANNVRIANCVANGNNSTNNEAFGILLDGTQGPFGLPVGASNVVVKCCQVFDTVSSSTITGHQAVGIATRNSNSQSTDIFIQDCQVYDSQATGNGSAAGISVDNTLRCNIEGSEANNSTAANGVADGIVLKGSTDNSTVRDSSVIGNQDSGFADLGANDNFFAGNYAENNGTDYNSVTAVAVVFDKSAGSFSATPNRWSNIQAVP